MPAPDPAAWDVWLAAHPPPDLQKLVRTQGSYSAVSRETWAQWDVACKAWETSRRDRLLGSHSWALMQPKPKKR